jgi:hypothetical protein
VEVSNSCSRILIFGFSFLLSIYVGLFLSFCVSFFIAFPLFLFFITVPCGVEPGIVLNRQGPGRHPLGGAPYLDLNMVLSEQGSGHHILSDALHRCPSVVKNE